MSSRRKRNHTITLQPEKKNAQKRRDGQIYILLERHTHFLDFIYLITTEVLH
jgi:hypothetical protein